MSPNPPSADGAPDASTKASNNGTAPAASPGILIASPQLRDPNFAGCVVLIWHHDQDGAMGAIINRASDLDMREITEQLELSAPAEPQAVLLGGPVQQESGYLVFDGPVDEAIGWNPRPGVAVTGSQAKLVQLLNSERRFLLCLGYSGWGPGQLEQEIKEGSWLYTEIEPDLLFETPIESRYEHALSSLGLHKGLIWMKAIDE